MMYCDLSFLVWGVVDKMVRWSERGCMGYNVRCEEEWTLNVPGAVASMFIQVLCSP